MLTLEFGIQVDMESETGINIDQFGDISNIISYSSTSIVANTTTGKKVTMTGNFNFASESALLNSDITGFVFQEADGSLVFSITGIENLKFSTFDNPDLYYQIMFDQFSAGLTIDGSQFSDVILGYTGNDVLRGGEGNDALRGGKGDDLLKGGDGDDTLKGGQGRDTLDGREGSDTYIVSANENKADAYKDSGAGPGDVDILNVSNVSSLMLTKSFSNDQRGIEVINGATTGTVLTGDGSAGLNWDFTDIGLTNITLKGTLLGDSITGSTGNDVIKGSWGKDTLSGGDGADTLKGGKGADDINADAGDDTLKGGLGPDTLDGGEGNDTYIVSANENRVDTYQDSGSSGVDTLDASNAALLMLTNTFNHGGAGIEVINGATTGTVLTGDGSGGLNWDFTDIGLTNIELRGTLLADRITGSAGDDTIKGSWGKDTLTGNGGDDTLKGGRGADSINGLDGDDFLKGGRGQDTLSGGNGDDTLTGGSGSDDFRMESMNEAGDVITDFDHAEGDQLLFNGGTGAGEFQWGYQSTAATKANTTGTITSNFLFEASTIGALISAVSSASSSLFGSTIASGVSSVVYFFGLTSSSGRLYYFMANQHTVAGSTTTTFSTITVATLEGITGLGTGIDQIALSDIILF